MAITRKQETWGLQEMRGDQNEGRAELDKRNGQTEEQVTGGRPDRQGNRETVTECLSIMAGRCWGRDAGTHIIDFHASLAPVAKAASQSA